MSDWPGLLNWQTGGVISTCGSQASLLWDASAITRAAVSAAAWPAANRALYMPFIVETTITAYKMAFEVGAQAGSYDVGIYDQLGNRLVSLGSTSVPAAGLAVADIADTTLTPAVYFAAMNCSTVTTLTIGRVTTNIGAQQMQAAGLQQQAVGATALPNPATFANPALSYTPALAIAFRTVI